MNKLFVIFAAMLGLLSPIFGFAAISDGQVAIANQTGNTVYVYDWDYGASTLKQEFTIAANATYNMTMTPQPMMRIYFSDQPLTNSMKKGLAPDIFNPGVDGDKRFTFAEYNNGQGNAQYTIDLSFIDTFSFPITIKFDNPDNQGKEWGIKSIPNVISSLNAAKEFGVNWGNLVWTRSDGSVLRIVGPNETMQFTANPPAFAPGNLVKFNGQFPGSGTSLAPTNWSAWQNSTTEPAKAGFVSALRAAGMPAQSFVIPPYVKTPAKYGYFTYPMDNANGEFTNVPLSVHSILTLYSMN